MPRLIHPALPRYDFHTDVQIYISHVNQGGHLDNAQLLTLVSEARVRFFQALGYREGHIEGTAVVVGDLMAQYKSEGYHGETLRIEMAASVVMEAAAGSTPSGMGVTRLIGTTTSSAWLA